MTLRRITIAFSQQELAALQVLAQVELRSLKDQMRHIVRSKLVQEGLLVDVEVEGDEPTDETTRHGHISRPSSESRSAKT